MLAHGLDPKRTTVAEMAAWLRALRHKHEEEEDDE